MWPNPGAGMLLCLLSLPPPQLPSEGSGRTPDSPAPVAPRGPSRHGHKGWWNSRCSLGGRAADPDPEARAGNPVLQRRVDLEAFDPHTSQRLTPRSRQCPGVPRILGGNGVQRQLPGAARSGASGGQRGTPGSTRTAAAGGNGEEGVGGRESEGGGGPAGREPRGRRRSPREAGSLRGIPGSCYREEEFAERSGAPAVPFPAPASPFTSAGRLASPRRGASLRAAARRPPPLRLRPGRPPPGCALRAAPAALAAGAGGRSGPRAPGRTAHSAGEDTRVEPRDFLPAGWTQGGMRMRAPSGGLRRLLETQGAGRGRSTDWFLY